jgi:hypothetical protein
MTEDVTRSRSPAPKVTPAKPVFNPITHQPPRLDAFMYNVDNRKKVKIGDDHSNVLKESVKIPTEWTKPFHNVNTISELHQ